MVEILGADDIFEILRIEILEIFGIVIKAKIQLHQGENTMNKEQFKEIIIFAVEREIEAERFYMDTAGKAKWPHIKELLLEMAKEEEKHAKFLLGIKLEELGDSTIQPIPDLKLSDYMVDMEYRPDMDFQSIMVIAMKREESAVKLYEDLGSTCTDPNVCKLFNMMAEEERKHKLRLEKEYEEHVLQDN